MNSPSNPLFQESLSLTVSDDGAIRRYIVFLSVVGVLMLLSWPREHFLYYVDPRRSPAVYMLTLMSSFFLGSFFISEFAIEFVGRDDYYTLSEWFRLSPVPLYQVFFGKVGFALLHTVFIFLLPMPFIVIAAGVCGITTYHLGLSVMIIFSAFLAYRFIGLVLIAVVERGRIGINFLLKVIIVMTLLLTPKYWPELNPIVAILKLQTAEPAENFLRTPPVYVQTAYVYLAAAAACILLFFGIIFVRERRYRHGHTK